jgi:hypothetical protein
VIRLLALAEESRRQSRRHRSAKRISKERMNESGKAN